MSTRIGHISSAKIRHRSGVSREIEDRTLFRDRNGRPIPNYKIVEEVRQGYEYFWSKRPASARPNNKSYR
jgi:hypothetical protein